MTNRTEAPRPSPTARELLESVDALMRRNRRTGAATSPLPPPEGHIIPAVLDDETQALSAEIEAELEAERIRETALLGNAEPLEATSPAAAGVSEFSPAVAVGEGDETADTAVQEMLEPVPGSPMEAFAKTDTVEDKAEAPVADASGEDVAAVKGGTPEKDDSSLAAWLREMLPAESLALVDRILPRRTEPADSMEALPVEEKAEAVQVVDGAATSGISEASETDAPVETTAIGGEAEEETATEEALAVAEGRPEDDLLLRGSVPPAAADVTATATVEPMFPGTEEAKSPEDSLLALTPSFSEVISFLSEPEILASPSQGSADYLSMPLTVAFDDAAAASFPPAFLSEPEAPPSQGDVSSAALPSMAVFDGVATEAAMGEKRVATEWVAEIPPETVPEEDAALDGEITWLTAGEIEETDETASAIDAGTAMNVAEALAPLSGTELSGVTDAASEAETSLPEESAGLWHLIEPEALPEVVPISMPLEMETAETGADFAGEVAFFEAAPVPGESRKAEGAAFEIVSPEPFELAQGDADDLEAGDEEIVLQPVFGDWADDVTDDAKMDGEPSLGLEAFASVVEAPAIEAAEADESGMVGVDVESAVSAPLAVFEDAPSSEPGMALETSSGPEDFIPVLPLEDAVFMVGEDEELIEEAPAFEEPVPQAGIAQQEAAVPSPAETQVAVVEVEETEAENETLAAQPFFQFESVPDVPEPKAEEAVPSPSAATLLSEQQRRDDETKAPPLRYSAAQLLTEYQHRNPQMQAQSTKATAVSPQPPQPTPPRPAQAARAEPLAAAALTLVDDDALSVASALMPLKAAKMAEAVETKHVPPVSPRKETALELTLEPLSHDAWSERPIASAVSVAPVAVAPLASPAPGNVLLDEEGYYPVLTDIVDGDEFSVSTV